MSPQNKSHENSSLGKLDPVWHRMCEDAREIADKDPALGGFLYSTILNHDSFECALMHRLSQRLDHADVSDELIFQVFEDALEADPEIGNIARVDIAATFDRDPACNRYIEPLLYFKGYQALQTHRMAHQLWKMGRHDFALYLQSRASQSFNVDIHPGARMGKGIMIDHATGVVIGETAIVEDKVSILHGVTLGGTGKKGGDRHPKVREGVLLGAGASVLGNIEVGQCARVASGSVVTKDVPENCTVAGVPAVVIGCAGCDEPAVGMNQILSSEEE